jgi:hypothetical protein
VTATLPGSRGSSTGWRTCLLLAALLLVAGGYLVVAPLERVSSTGVPFDCGTALRPAGGDFARSVCGDLNLRRQLQSGAAGLAVLVLVGGGWLAFGPRRDRPAADPPDGPDRQPADEA